MGTVVAGGKERNHLSQKNSRGIGLQFGEDLLHQTCYFLKDKHITQQIKQWLQFQIQGRKLHLKMMLLGMFTCWTGHRLQHIANSREDKYHLNSRH